MRKTFDMTESEWETFKHTLPPELRAALFNTKVGVTVVLFDKDSGYEFSRRDVDVTKPEWYRGVEEQYAEYSKGAEVTTDEK